MINEERPKREELTQYQQAVKDHIAEAPEELREYVWERLKDIDMEWASMARWEVGQDPIYKCGFKWSETKERARFWNNVANKKWKKAMQTDFWKQHTAITKLKECVTKELDEEYEELTDDERLNFDFDVTYSEKISLMYDSLKELQLKKNADYGDSVFLDINVFGESISAKQGVLARIADKIKRLESKDLKVDESKKDTIKDLIGYLVALLIIEQK
jgi:hypothetical protein